LSFWSRRRHAGNRWRCSRLLRRERRDLALNEIVIRKCEGDFLPKLSKSQRQAYDQQQKRCSRKYLK